MGRDPNMGREDLKNGSRQGDLNPLQRFFARSEFSKSAEFVFSPFIKSFKISTSYTFSWIHLNKIRSLHHKLFSQSFNGRPAAAELAEITFYNSEVVKIAGIIIKNCVKILSTITRGARTGGS